MRNNEPTIWLSLLAAKNHLGRGTAYGALLAEPIIIAASLSPRVRKRGELDREFVKRDITHLISPAAKVDIRLGRIKNPDPAGMSFERVLPLGRIENPAGMSFECVELEQHDLEAYAAEYHDVPPPHSDPSENGPTPAIDREISPNNEDRRLTRRAPPRLDKVIAWLKDRIETWPPDVPTPTEHEDLTAAQDALGDVRRAQLRKAVNDLGVAQRWRKPGPRSSGAKSAE